MPPSDYGDSSDPDLGRRHLHRGTAAGRPGVEPILRAPSSPLLVSSGIGHRPPVLGVSGLFRADVFSAVRAGSADP